MQPNNPFGDRPPLWLYHEPSPREWQRPEHLNLCLETVQKHCGRRFRVIPLTRYTIYTYLPNLRKDVWYTCSYKQRIDLMRWELLARYGGMFVDPEVLVLRDLTPYVNKLHDHDFVAFGNGTHLETASTPTTNPHSHTTAAATSTAVTMKPLTWAMASRPNGELVTLARQKCHWMLDNKSQLFRHSPHLLGNEMLWACMTMLGNGSTPDRPWRYFHVSPTCSQSDDRGVPYTPDRFLMNEAVSEACLTQTYLVPLNPEDGTCTFPPWFVQATREQLLGNANLLVGKLWRWSLLHETPFPPQRSGSAGSADGGSTNDYYAPQEQPSAASHMVYYASAMGG
jgi:hypothetical protein